VVVFGVLCVLVPAGAGALLSWQNRNAIVEVHVGGVIWTARLYGVLIIGALMACWLLLGVAFIQCRIAERRRARELLVQPETGAAAGSVREVGDEPSVREVGHEARRWRPSAVAPERYSGRTT
jgi:hypothetical protein